MRAIGIGIILSGLVALCGAAPARAQPVSFEIVGHIQRFTLDTPGALFSGAKMTINGIDVVIPSNTVVLMPAAYLTPQQIFTVGPGMAPPGTPAGKSGLALDDRAAPADPPLAAFEATLTGNIVGGVYIAGLVQISQQSLNNGAGFIRRIDYGTGEMCVGANPAPVATCAAPDARVRINDPGKVYGANNSSPDERFSMDGENPTIHALTGYPMCLPGVAPPASDPNCPVGNRPLAGGTPLATFVMSGPDIPSSSLPPGQAPIVSCRDPLPACDPDQQAPLMPGDFINFKGTLARDADPAHPYFISAHTVEANVGIYTRAGAGNTAYLMQEKTLLGTQGPIVAGTCAAALECTARLRIVDFITDPTRARQVGVYALDVDAAGKRRSRRLAAVQKAQAPFGRFRFEVAKAPTLVPDGLGATREIMVRIDDPAPLPDGTEVADKDNAPELVRAHGLIAGQYVAPVGEYLFPEGLVMGAPPPPANFQCLAFLTAGWATSSIAGPIGQLAPWPGSPTPPASAAGIRCDN